MTTRVRSRGTATRVCCRIARGGRCGTGGSRSSSSSSASGRTGACCTCTRSSVSPGWRRPRRQASGTGHGPRPPSRGLTERSSSGARRPQCDAFRADGDGAKTIWYLSKALNYVLKDVATGADEVPVPVWRHQVALGDAARRMRCSRDCAPQDCASLVHRRYGSRTQVVSASRRTKTRPGWSFTGLTRTAQRALRRAWWESRQQTPDEPQPAPSAPAAVEKVAVRARREVIARGPSAP